MVMEMRSVMNRLLLLLALMALPYGLCQGASRPEWAKEFSEANAMYQRGHYDSAARKYEALLADSAVADALYYNLGNAYYRMHQYPKAILAYERALKYNPSNADAEFNLGMAKTYTQDRLAEAERLPFTGWMSAIPAWLTPRGWGGAALLFFTLTLLLLLLMRFAWSRAVWKWSGIAGIVMLVAFVFTLSVGLVAQRHISDSREAIVMQSVVSIKSSPDDQGKDLFLLHAGAKVSILESLGPWLEVEIPDGHRGWVHRETVEEI